MLRKSRILLLAFVVGLILTILSRSNPASPAHEYSRPSTAEAKTGSHGIDPDNEFAAHVEQLKKRLPSPDFSIVSQPPFVVVGDESADVVKEHSEHTVKWAVEK